MYSWGALDKHSIEIDLELELLKKQLGSKPSATKKADNRTIKTNSIKNSDRKKDLSNIDEILLELKKVIA